MCWYSVEHGASDCSVGQVLTVGMRHGRNLLLDPDGRPTCAIDQSVLRFKNLPVTITAQLGVEPECEAIFAMFGERDEPKERYDMLMFDNGKELDFQKLPTGIQMTVLRVGPEEDKTGGGQEELVGVSLRFRLTATALAAIAVFAPLLRL